MVSSISTARTTDSSGKSAQKRRGKLVRDRTIDNADEHLSTSGFSHNKVNIMMSTSNRLNADLASRLISPALKDSAKDMQSKKCTLPYIQKRAYERA